MTAALRATADQASAREQGQPVQARRASSPAVLPGKNITQLHERSEPQYRSGVDINYLRSHNVRL